MTSNYSKQRQNQAGIVSIMMTVVMMLVISLIVLGLAQISRREQRKSVDNQLTAQAFYAAESGVNDVINILKAAPAVEVKSDCSTPSPTSIYSGLNPNLGSGISYSCVIVEPSPRQVTGQFTGDPSVYSLVTEPADPDSLTFSWSPPSSVPSGATTGCPSAVTGKKKDLFPLGASAEAWGCAYAVLRVDLVSAPTPITRDNLITKTQTMFMVPDAGLGSAQSSGFAPNTSKTLAASCNVAAKKCSYTITGLSGNNYYARVSGVYTGGTVSISGVDSTGTAVKFAGQATIDVTGKAQDILRRVKVTVNLKGGNQNSDGGAAIMSGDSICKRFMIKEDNTATDTCTP